MPSAARSDADAAFVGRLMLNINLFGCDCRRITRVELCDSLPPHLHERARSQIFDRLPDVLDRWKCVLPDGTLAPLLPRRRTSPPLFLSTLPLLLYWLSHSLNSHLLSLSTLHAGFF